MSIPFFIASVQLRSLERSQAPYMAPSVDLFSIVDCPEFPMFSRETIPQSGCALQGTREAASSQRKARTASAVPTT
jgi:hypothetical protein